MNLNKVFIIGNLTRDPESRSTTAGQPIATFSVATNRVWKDKQGVQQRQAEFHNVVFFGRLAEIAQQYLKKGSMVMVEGRIQTRSWEGQDGQKKYRTEIVGEGMQLGPRGGVGGVAREENGETQASKEPETIATVEYPEDEIRPEDIPF